jgi:four helix bundle protein
MELEELKVYELAMQLGDKIWSQVIVWNSFAQETMGKQLVRAIDSVAANLSEGFGRYFYKDTRLFCYYSRGSLFESKTFLTKAFKRGLITKDDFDDYSKSIKDIGIKLNNYIKALGKAYDNNVARECETLYGSDYRIELEHL